jgi:hypothetical protein
VDRFHRENPKAIRAICLKEEEVDNFEAMPYTHPDDASLTLSPAIIQSFFRQTGPYSPLIRDSDQRQVITIKMLLGRPSFQNPQDRGEPSDSEEEGGSSSDGEVHSTYGTA